MVAGRIDGVLRYPEELKPITSVLIAILLAACASIPVSPQRASVIGVIQGVPPDLARPRVDALRAGLEALGYREGRDLTLEVRYLEGQGQERAAQLTRELVSLGAALIVTGNFAGVEGARRASSDTPIVLAGVGFDPVGDGWVSSLARPGTNITGISFQAPGSSGKRLQLLMELASGSRRIGLLHDSTASSGAQPEIEAAAQDLGIELETIEVRTAAELEAAFDRFGSERIAAVLITVGSVTSQQFDRIADLALVHRIATATGVLDSATAGGLLALAPDQTDLYRRAAAYVDKILKGASPGDLPVEQPEKFELVINLRTAQALGITVPEHILQQATQVIR